MEAEGTPGAIEPRSTKSTREMRLGKGNDVCGLDCYSHSKAELYKRVLDEPSLPLRQPSPDRFVRIGWHWTGLASRSLARRRANLVSQNFTSWNQIAGWLSRLHALKNAA